MINMFNAIAFIAVNSTIFALQIDLCFNLWNPTGKPVVPFITRLRPNICRDFGEVIRLF
jgi:hypothetical protein